MALNLIRYGPPSVVVDLLSSWLDLADVCRLDTALTSGSDRPQYTHYFSAYSNLLFNADVNIVDESIFLKWIVDRQLNVNKLKLTSSKHDDGALLSVLPLSSKVTSIHIENLNITESTLDSLLRSTSRHLRELRLIGCSCTDKALSVLHSKSGLVGPNLQSLTLGNCSNLTDESLALLEGSTRGLTSFYVYDCKFSVNGLVAFLENCHASLESFHCDRCFEVEGMLPILKQLASDKHIAVKRFNVRHKHTVDFDTTVLHAQQWIQMILTLELRGSVVLHIGDVVNTIQTNIVFK